MILVTGISSAKRGVGRNFKLVFSLLTDSAHSGHVVAQYNLGRLYRHGLGTNKNLEQDSRWFPLAADAGYLPARKQLETLK